MSIHVCILGPSLCGKSHLAKIQSHMLWRLSRRRSLVLYPPGHVEGGWGPHALVTYDRDHFLHVFWRERNLAVFVEEATETVGRDAELTGLFTRGRHRGHIVHCMGHRATVLLPIQRDQFGTLFLFRQSPQAAGIFAEEWAEPRIHDATTLKKYEFLLCQKFAAADGGHLIMRGRY